MFDIVRKELDLGGRKLVLETGRMARQADGAVLVTYGETTVLCTVVAEKQARPGQPFFPLAVHYMERTYAAGKIPGGFFKREGRPSEKETLTSRLIDRPIRPLFPEGFVNEVQLVCQVLSHDLENNPDIPAMIGASAALSVAGVPFAGPIGGARVGLVDGEMRLNPTASEMEESRLDLIVAGTDEGVLMVESEAHELSEKQMLEAVMHGWRSFQPVVEAIKALKSEAGKADWPVPAPSFDAQALAARVQETVGEDLAEAYRTVVKQERQDKIAAAKDKALAALESEEVTGDQISAVFKKLEKDLVRGQILETGNRIDGRTTSDIRAILSEVGVLPRAHGSALFTRGETQAIVVATLGTGQDEQIVDALEGEYRQHFLLHYNFPPYSVGETGRVGFTSRREVGHGKLAWRAVHPLLPSKEDFPYTIRAVSEITESNGSSSMATVCGTSLALMDAGVPMPRPCAGIAMGLIKEGEDFAVLSDILGDEDHLGDMDFKVAGTEAGVTSLQMDIKITSITEEIMEKALDQARDGRMHILGRMADAIDEARGEVSEHAPRMTVLQIPEDKIRDVIGPGGKIIREICETTGAKIDIDDDGTVRIAASEEEASRKAVAWIQSITAEPEMGVIYQGRVVKIMDFGAFVNFLGKRDGLVHISEIQEGRVNKVTDVLSEGDIIKVKVIGFDDRGKVKLSMRVVDQETGADLSKQRQAS